MSEFKGTQGEWRFEQNKEFPTLHEIWSSEKSIFKNGTLIARTCYAPLSKFNSLLISKALEMLSLLSDILETIDYEEMDADNKAHYKVKLTKLIKEATELK